MKNIATLFSLVLLANAMTFGGAARAGTNDADNARESERLCSVGVEGVYPLVGPMDAKSDTYLIVLRSLGSITTISGPTRRAAHLSHNKLRQTYRDSGFTQVAGIAYDSGSP